MTRGIVMVGAASGIGAAPYEDGEVRHLDRAPRVLRQRGIRERIQAMDVGDVAPPPYRDFVRPTSGIRNEREVAAYSRALAERVRTVAVQRRFALVVGGDCSVVLGCLLGARRSLGRAVPDLGLAYIDAHADFAVAGESRTGSVASMALALSVGRGEGALSRLGGAMPLVDPARVAIVGRRDDDEPWRGHAALALSGVLDVPGAPGDLDPDRLATRVLARVAAPGVGGFWIHVDVDILSPSVMSAVDSPTPGGPTVDGLAALLRPLARHPLALGLSLTVYDPALDPDRSGARQIVKLVAAVFRA